MKLPENLRREEIIIEPAGDLTGCKMMGDEVTEVLEYLPGELYVKKYKRLKYVKPDGSGILIGSLPIRPLEKAMAGEGLLSQILIDKYVDHLPLHRQMQRFERAGVKIPYATLSGWVSETCNLITPLYEALKKEVSEKLIICTPMKHRYACWIKINRAHRTKDITGYTRTVSIRSSSSITRKVAAGKDR